MKTTTLAMPHWPYGLVIEQSDKGILLRPRRKAREGWSKAFKRTSKTSDDLSEVRMARNEFDRREWEW
jgi:hypothetical protein